jgi:hypothetical protein
MGVLSVDSVGLESVAAMVLNIPWCVERMTWMLVGSTASCAMPSSTTKWRSERARQADRQVPFGGWGREGLLYVL